MTSGPPVVIYPPDEDGGRRVRIDSTIVGRAFSVQDVARFMQEAGLQELDEMDVVRAALIECATSARALGPAANFPGSGGKRGVEPPR